MTRPTVKVRGGRYTAAQLAKLAGTAIEHLQSAVDALPRAVARDAEHPVVDGWPTGGGERTSGGDVSRPAEAAGLKLADPNYRPSPDPVHDIVSDLARAVLDAHQAATSAHHALKRLSSLTADYEGRVSSVQTCGACERTVAGTSRDPLRSGWCDACRKAFGREVKAAEAAGVVVPERQVWALQRKQEKAGA